MRLPDLQGIERAAEVVYRTMQPSPQINWPLLDQRVGCEVWVKHENHNPTGAFKIRGGLLYIDRLLSRDPECPGICAATRGNHGQSAALAAAAHRLRTVIVVPEGNSPDKNAAMQAYGAELLVHGADFDAALAYARELSEKDDLHFMPSIDGDLIPGVATYALELFRAAPPLDRVYVPIGLGSGICGVLAAKQALGIDTDVIGVVSANANTYELSLNAGEVVSTNTADTIADGLAVKTASAEALGVMQAGVARIVTVEDDEVLRAVSYYFTDTHNVAEGAGAAPLAALLKDSPGTSERVGLILTGGNINQSLLWQALALVADEASTG